MKLRIHGVALWGVVGVVLGLGVSAVSAEADPLLGMALPVATIEGAESADMSGFGPAISDDGTVVGYSIVSHGDQGATTARAVLQDR